MICFILYLTVLKIGLIRLVSKLFIIETKIKKVKFTFFFLLDINWDLSFVHHRVVSNYDKNRFSESYIVSDIK